METFELGSWRVEPQLNRLIRGRESVVIEPKAMDVLAVLLRAHGRVVTVEELLDSVWAGQVVEPGAVHQKVRLIRKALGDEAANPRFIETVPRRGYRVIATVTEPRPSATPAMPPPRRGWGAAGGLLIVLSALALPWIGDRRSVEAEMVLAVDKLLAQADYLRLRSGDPAAALSLVEQALALRPDHIDAAAFRAQLLYSVPDLGPVNDPRRRYELARQANEQVLSAHPEHPLAWFTKAQLHAVLDLDFAAAMDAFVEAERFGMPAVPVRVQQAALHLWSGDSRRALERVRLAEELNPRSAQVKEYVARCLFHNGRVDAAYAKWDEALRIDPRDRYVFGMALRHALVNEDVVRARSLMIHGRRFPEIVPEWAEAWIRHLEGDSFRLRTLADRWTWDGAAAASPITQALIAFALGDYEGHIRTWRERELRRSYLHTAWVETGRPGYWKRLEEWAGTGPDAVRRQRLLVEHRARIERIALSAERPGHQLSRPAVPTAGRSDSW